MSDSILDPSGASHPDSVLRLASAVHRFRIPYINPRDQLSFEESFKTCSKVHRNTRLVMQQVRYWLYLLALRSLILLLGYVWFSKWLLLPMFGCAVVVGLLAGYVWWPQKTGRLSSRWDQAIHGSRKIIPFNIIRKIERVHVSHGR